MAMTPSIDEVLARFDAACKAAETLAQRGRQAGQRAAAAELEYAALKADRARLADELAEVRRKAEALTACQEAAREPVAAAIAKITAMLES